MKKNFLIIGLLACVLISGCFEPPVQLEEKPEDFAFYYREEAMHLEWG